MSGNNYHTRFTSRSPYIQTTTNNDSPSFKQAVGDVYTKIFFPWNILHQSITFFAVSKYTGGPYKNQI